MCGNSRRYVAVKEYVNNREAYARPGASKMIKHNKDLFERVGDTMALLEKLHIY